MIPGISMLMHELPADPRPERLMVTEVVYEHDKSFGGSDLPWGSLPEAIEFLKSKLEEIPPEYRAASLFEIEDGSDGYGSIWVEMRVVYQRPETDDEMQSRLVTAKRQRISAEALQRAEYERLKAKFG